MAGWRKMRLPVYRTHIAQFNMAQCQDVIDICEKEFNKEVA